MRARERVLQMPRSPDLCQRLPLVNPRAHALSPVQSNIDLTKSATDEGENMWQQGGGVPEVIYALQTRRMQMGSQTDVLFSYVALASHIPAVANGPDLHGHVLSM